MKFFKKCLKCDKNLFRRYDEIKYKALNQYNEVQIYTVYICTACSNEIHDDTDEFVENIKYKDKD